MLKRVFMQILSYIFHLHIYSKRWSLLIFRSFCIAFHFLAPSSTSLRASHACVWVCACEYLLSWTLFFFALSLPSSVHSVNSNAQFKYVCINCVFQESPLHISILHCYLMCGICGIWRILIYFIYITRVPCKLLLYAKCEFDQRRPFSNVFSHNVQFRFGHCFVC